MNSTSVGHLKVVKCLSFDELKFNKAGPLHDKSFSKRLKTPLKIKCNKRKNSDTVLRFCQMIYVHIFYMS